MRESFHLAPLLADFFETQIAEFALKIVPLELYACSEGFQIRGSMDLEDCKLLLIYLISL